MKNSMLLPALFVLAIVGTYLYLSTPGLPPFSQIGF